MHFMDNSLVGTEFTTKDILNFLYNGPEREREAGMPNFDWRNIFNITDQLIHMFNQYGEVSNLSLFLCLPTFFLNFAHSYDKAFGLFGRLCLNSTDKSVCLPGLLPRDCARLFDTGHNHLAQLFHTAAWKVARTCLLSPPSLVSIVHSVIK